MYREYAPPEDLKAYIQCFWRLEREYPSLDDPGETVWPDGRVELLFHYGDRYRLETDLSQQLPEGFVIGPLTKPVKLYSEGKVRLYGVRFLNWGFQQFYYLPMDWFTDQVLPLADLIGDEAAEMEVRLSQADPDIIPDLLAAWVRERLVPPMDARDKGMSKLVSSMEHANMQGGISVQDWAEQTGWSNRQLERKFKEGVGMTPKQWQQIHRFNSARKMILKDPDVDLSDVIHRCGYYDYAHFSKDFDRFYEMTPKAFQQWVNESRQKFTDPDRVVFLQDSED